jgi:hypothetical protein
MSSTLLAPKLAEPSADLTAVEARAIFERASQRYLKMAADEFVEKWKAGYFRTHLELAHKAADVALLLPLLSAR